MMYDFHHALQQRSAKSYCQWPRPPVNGEAIEVQLVRILGLTDQSDQDIISVNSESTLMAGNWALIFSSSLMSLALMALRI